MASSEGLGKEGEGFSVRISGGFRCREGSIFKFCWGLFSILFGIFNRFRGAVGVIFGHFLLVFPLFWHRSLSCCCISCILELLLLPDGCVGWKVSKALLFCVGGCGISFSILGPRAIFSLAFTSTDCILALGAGVLTASNCVLCGDVLLCVLTCVELLQGPGVLGPSSCVGFPDTIAPGTGVFSALLSSGGLPLGGCVGNISWFTCLGSASRAVGEWEFVEGSEDEGGTFSGLKFIGGGEKGGVEG